MDQARGRSHASGNNSFPGVTGGDSTLPPSNVNFQDNQNQYKPGMLDHMLVNPHEVRTSLTAPPCIEGPIPNFTERLVVRLAVDDNEHWCSELVRFARYELVEIFRANKEDVSARILSKRVVHRQIDFVASFARTYQGNNGRIAQRHSHQQPQKSDKVLQ